jgi:hypothetical protein
MELVILYNYAFEVIPGITDHTTLPYDSPLLANSVTAGAGVGLVDEAKLGGMATAGTVGGPAGGAIAPIRSKGKKVKTSSATVDGEEVEEEDVLEPVVLHYKLRLWETSMEKICSKCTYLLTDTPPKIPPTPLEL